MVSLRRESRSNIDQHSVVRTPVRRKEKKVFRTELVFMVPTSSKKAITQNHAHKSFWKLSIMRKNKNLEDGLNFKNVA